MTAQPNSFDEHHDAPGQSLATLPCSAFPVVIDPDYAAFLVKARIVAKQDGYAIAIHGSMTRDFDLIAVPWIDNPRSAQALSSRIAFNTGWPRQKSDGTRGKLGEAVDPTIREHGRMVWTFVSPEHGLDTPGAPDPRFIDFSVMPTVVSQNVKAQGIEHP